MKKGEEVWIFYGVNVKSRKVLAKGVLLSHRNGKWYVKVKNRILKRKTTEMAVVRPKDKELFND